MSHHHIGRTYELLALLDGNLVEPRVSTLDILPPHIQLHKPLDRLNLQSSVEAIRGLEVEPFSVTFDATNGKNTVRMGFANLRRLVELLRASTEKCFEGLVANEEFKVVGHDLRENVCAVSGIALVALFPKHRQCELIFQNTLGEGIPNE